MKKIELTTFSKIILIWVVLLFFSSITMLFLAKTGEFRIRLAFNAFQSVIMFCCLLLPIIVKKKMKYKISSNMEIIYVSFCTCSFVLGEIKDFYGLFPWWDSMLHLMSGVLLGALGFIILNTMNKVDGKKLRFDPLFASAVVVFFAISMGCFWEFIEYAIDDLFGANMQQFMTGTGTLDQGEPLVGHEALRDTMKDLFLAFLGSLTISLIGFLELKYAKKGISTMEFEKTIK